MRARVVAAVVGLILTIGGVLFLGVAVVRLSGGPTYSECIGEDCLNDPSFLGLPLGILGIVFGLIIGGWALGSIREERGIAGPLAAFGFMSGLGGVFIALGAIFLVAFNAPAGDGDGTFLFLGGLFGLMGLSFVAVDLVRFRTALKKDRLRLSGLHGTARVMAVRDSNVTINNSPMVNLDLEVTIPGRVPFRTKKRVVISRLSVGALFPGAIIPVLADPAKPTDVMLDWDGVPESPDGSQMFDAAAMAQAFGAFLGGSGGAAFGGAAGDASAGAGATGFAGTIAAAAAAGATHVVDAGRPPGAPVPAPALGAVDIPLPGATADPGSGLPARVSLDSIQDTGVDIGGDRLYAFDLTVSVAGRQPYQTKHAAVVPAAQVPRLVRGASFPAQVDPAQPGQIAVRWDR